MYLNHQNVSLAKKAFGQIIFGQMTYCPIFYFPLGMEVSKKYSNNEYPNIRQNLIFERRIFDFNIRIYSNIEYKFLHRKTGQFFRYF
jgi:hypothetical protein